MKEQIVIRSLPQGLWEIHVILHKSHGEFITRGKRCRI